MRDLTEQ